MKRHKTEILLGGVTYRGINEPCHLPLVLWPTGKDELVDMMRSG